MNNDKKIKEPYRPEDTPSPPQIIEPGRTDEPEKKKRADEKPAPANEKKEKSAPQNEKLLGESETEITDETTI